MSESQILTAKNSQRFSYYPATFRRYPSVGSVIEYYVRTGDRMIRKTIKLNRIEKRCAKREFSLYVANLLQDINYQLSVRFLPQFSHSAPPSAPTEAPIAKKKEFSLCDICEKYIVEKTKELRPDSLRSYRSFCKLLLEWCKGNDIENVSEINNSAAVDYMDYMYNEREISPTSYNNYLKLARAFFSWCVSKNYIAENPFSIIQKKRTDEKKRVIIPPEERAKLSTCKAIRHNYVILCMLVYNSLIRPREISKIQIKHIHLDKHYIEIPGANAKNHKTRCAALSPELIIELTRMNLDRYPLDYYLFGSKIEPAKERAGNYCYLKYWRKVRNYLNWKNEYTLYSFRDTGITEMLESGIPANIVMKHADHSSLEITSIYLKHQDKELVNKVYYHTPKF